jgi:hypothetical protein
MFLIRSSGMAQDIEGGNGGFTRVEGGPIRGGGFLLGPLIDLCRFGKPLLDQNSGPSAKTPA